MSIYIPQEYEALEVARLRGRNSEAPNLWQGLIADWPFLQGGGSTLYDIAGSNHGTLTNMDPATDWVMTEKGWALDFKDTTGQYVDVVGSADANSPSLSAPSVTNSFTIAARINFHDLATRGAIGKHLSSANGYAIWVNSNDIRIVAGNASNEIYVNTEQILANHVSVDEWHDWVAVYAFGRRAELWLDGNLIDSHTETVNTGVANVANTFKVAAEDAADHTWDASVAHTLIYSRDLTPSEIQQLYEDPHAMHRKRPTTVAFADAGGAAVSSSNVGKRHRLLRPLLAV